MTKRIARIAGLMRIFLFLFSCGKRDASERRMGQFCNSIASRCYFCSPVKSPRQAPKTLIQTLDSTEALCVGRSPLVPNGNAKNDPLPLIVRDHWPSEGLNTGTGRPCRRHRNRPRYFEKILANNTHNSSNRLRMSYGIIVFKF